MRRLLGRTARPWPGCLTGTYTDAVLLRCGTDRRQQNEPTLAIDPRNNEIWVANYADHTALVFARTATGDAAPKRIVRNAPAGTPTGGFGNPYAVAYDSKREQLLVPN